MKFTIRTFRFYFSLAVTICLILSSSLAYGARSDVEAFVTRFYQQCLSRNPDVSGLNGWVNALWYGWLSGSDVANGFIFSQEFIGRNTSNEDFLTILYRAFFNREPDPSGYAGWLNYLYSGASRQAALNGFINSVEFSNLCAFYGIKPFAYNYDGTWSIQAYNGSPPWYSCKGGQGTLTISNSIISGTFRSDWGWSLIALGSVDANGNLSSGMALGNDDIAVFTGYFQQTTGYGSWEDIYGCYGTWSAIKLY